MSAEGVVDIAILGAGPTGLAAAYYAGHRDASVRIIESLEQLGGQVAAVYPEKHVYDVAGHPKILGTKLVDLCAEQGLQYDPELHLGEEVQTLDRISQNGEELLAVSTNKGGPYLSRAPCSSRPATAPSSRASSGSRGSTSGRGGASTTSSARRTSFATAPA